MIVDEEELTFGCGEGGRLIGCTFCFNSAHAECCGLGDQRVNAPRGDWACPACVDHARAQLKCDSDDDGESGDDDENDCDGESGGNEDESEEEKSDDSEDDSDGDENEEESEDSEEEDDDVSVLMNWIQNSNTTIRMLKEKCRSVGLKMNGRKHEVVERLLDHFS